MALKSAGEKEVNELKKLEDIDIPSPSEGEVLQYDAASKKWVAATGGGGGAHHTTHEDGGSDEINVAGLSGELADPQPPKSHKTSHATGGSDALSPADIGAIAAPASPAAGDVLYYDGSNWVKLAKDVGKYLKSLASAVGWDTPAGGGGGDLSWARYLKIGVIHVSPLHTTNMAATINITVDRLYASAFPIPIQMTFDRIGSYVYTTGAGNARLGIYNDDGGYPGSLVLDAGLIDVSSGGRKEIEINQQLSAGLYWIAYIGDIGHSFDCSQQDQNLEITGIVGRNGKGAMYYVAQAYGALPATYPLGATQLGVVGAFTLRRSA